MLSKYLRYAVKNYLFAILALLFTILYFISAAGLPQKATDFPRALIGILVPLFVWNFVSSITGFRKMLRADLPEGEKWECGLNVSFPKIVIAVSTILYVVLMPVIGFAVTTVLYLGCLSYYLGIRNPVKLCLFAFLYTAVLYGIFGMWLSVRLPSGIFM